jgi:hypothetical protein
VFPWRDLPYREDMGRTPREFQVQAYCVGEFYKMQRDGLIAALEIEGPGTLVHAYHGVKQVVCKNYTVKENVSEGRMCRFSLTFAEAGAPKFPTAEINTSAAVQSSADSAARSALVGFADSFDVSGGPSFVSEHARDVLGRATEFIGSVRSKLGNRAGFRRHLSRLTESLPELIRTPHLLGGELITCLSDFNAGSVPVSFDSGGGPLIGSFTDVYRGSDFHFGRMNEMTDVSRFGDALPAVTGSTPQALRMNANQEAIAALVRRAGIIEACRSSALVSFSNYDQAATAKLRLTDDLDIELDFCDSDELFGEMTDLRAAVVKDITVRSADLARLIEIRPIRPIPSLVLAYRLYEGIDRADEIAEQNRVRHPGFVPAEPVRVLSHA